MRRPMRFGCVSCEYFVLAGGRRLVIVSRASLLVEIQVREAALCCVAPPDSATSGLPAMSSPPRTRLRSAAHDEVEAIVDAVVARLVSSGMLGAAAAAPAAEVGREPEPGPGPEQKPAVQLVAEVGPGRAQQQLWLEELRLQQTASLRFGVREKEEVRALLIIGDGGGPPPAHHAWYWGRVRLMLIVAHHGWAAAVDDARSADMDRLGIRLSAVAVRPAAPPAVPPPAAEPVRRGRPSRPSGLRPPPRRPTPSATAGRQAQ